MELVIMLEQPRDICGMTSQSRAHSCGHILIGKRQYKISLASDIPGQPGSEEVCRFVLDGRTLVVAEAKKQHNEVSNGSDDVKSRLTGRELEIAVLVAQGYATKNIAYKLQISEWTVSTYLCRAFHKLGVNSRAAMVYRLASLIDTLHDD
jgi:DNA-binding CsgD family transcriptional regulator